MSRTIIHICNPTILTSLPGSLNAARGSLKTKLHGYLYSPCRRLLGSVACKIKEKVFYQYHKGLEQTGAWPIEIHGNKNSINGLLRLVGKFKYDDPHVGSEAQAVCEEPRDCMNGPKFKTVISDATAELNDQFDGLCLGKNLVSKFILTSLTSHRLHELFRKQRRGCRL